MMKLLKDTVQGTFRAAGFELTNLQNTWGVTFWGDIRRLTLGKEISTVFDVGANVGTTARLFARRFSQAQVFAFEPVPTTYKTLLENTKDIETIKCFNIGFGDKLETKDIYIFRNSEVSTVVRNSPYAVKILRSEPLSSASISLQRLDDFTVKNNVEQVQVLKIDTEGFDLQVIKGAHHLLERNAVTFLYCEFNDLFPSSELAGGALSDIHVTLTQENFKLVGLYVDYIKPENEFFAVRNALYVNTISYRNLGTLQ